MGEAELSTVIDHADAGVYCEADVRYNGVDVAKAGIKARGNTSYVAETGGSRYSFKIKFNKYTKGQKLNGLDELYLNNMAYDPSYVREYLAYSLFARTEGVHAPLVTFAKLTINGEYYGLYLAIEGIDDSFLKRSFGDNDGNLYEAEKGSAFVDDDTSTFSLENGDDTSFSRLTSLYNALNTGEGIDAILDTESVLRYAAIIDVICGQESYLGEKAENFYLYERSDGRLSIIPWDLKMSFGTDRSLRKTEYQIDGEMIKFPVASPYFGVEAVDRPLVGKLLENSELKAKYLSYVRSCAEELSSMLEKLPQLKSFIDAAVSSDEKRFYDDALYQAEFSDGEKTLYGFIKQRCAFIASELSAQGK
jgi:spore coat protein CotH